MEAVVEGIGGCCFTGAVSKTCKLFFGRNSFRINVSYDSDTRYCYCCFGGCFLIGTEYGAWRLFERKLADVALLQLNLEYGSSFVKDSFNSNANFDKEPRHYYCCFGGSCSTGTESGAWKFF
uniref:Uncharacterized protein n=2 Tax=Strongyloides stercoralis TaxID=6248 RepID=A0A0K0EFK6_STRER